MFDPGPAAVEDGYNIYGHLIVHAVEKLLVEAGDDLTRENIMRQAASLVDVELPMLMSGIRVNTSPTDFATIQEAYLMQFDGATGEWTMVSELLRGE